MVQVKVYGVIRGDMWDREKGRVADPFKPTFPVVKVSPSSDTVTGVDPITIRQSLILSSLRPLSNQGEVE